MICISIQEKHRGKATSLANTATMAEIRIDLAGFKPKDVEFIFSKADSFLIATCRPEIVEDETLRIELLKTAIEHGADYVDVEIEASKAVKDAIIPFAKANNCKVIVSYHNYENTPTIDELEKIIADCYSAGADIAKIATTAVTKQDSARILSLYSTERELVALAMGEEGRITRVANIALGSPFTFACVDEEQITAPGQMTTEEMQPFLFFK